MNNKQTKKKSSQAKGEIRSKSLDEPKIQTLNSLRESGSKDLESRTFRKNSKSKTQNAINKNTY